MPEAEVLYSDVKFTRATGNGNRRVSSSADTTYSEVKIPKAQPSTELPGPQQEAPSNGGSKATSERVALVVLSVLLAAALIALGVASYKFIDTVDRFQKLTDEHQALKKNITGRPCQPKPCTVQPTCPKPPAGNISDSCQTCDEGWEQHRGKCYYFSSNKSSWSDSRGECERKGGALVKIDSTDEQGFLDVRLRDKMEEAEDKFWIGLSDLQTEGTWLWVDGSRLDNSTVFWSKGEPDDWKGSNQEYPEGEDCVRMGERGGAIELKSWFDSNCKFLHKFICEKAERTGRVTCV